MTIARSAGTPITIDGMPTGYRAGGGYRGFTDELDAIVAEAAVRLEAWSGMDVTIRFNSDRKSGSAFLLTDPNDGVWKNAELGVGGGIHDTEWDEETGERTLVEPTLYISVLIKPVCLREPDDFDMSGWGDRYWCTSFDTLDDAFAFVEQHATIEKLNA